MGAVLLGISVILLILIVGVILIALILTLSSYLDNVDTTIIDRFFDYFENKGKELAEKRNRRDGE